MTEGAILEVAERIYALSAPPPNYLVVHPDVYYQVLVAADDPLWLVMPFKVICGETRGQVEERWLRRQKVLGHGGAA